MCSTCLGRIPRFRESLGFSPTERHRWGLCWCLHGTWWSCCCWSPVPLHSRYRSLEYRRHADRPAWPYAHEKRNDTLFNIRFVSSVSRYIHGWLDLPEPVEHIIGKSILASAVRWYSAGWYFCRSATSIASAFRLLPFTGSPVAIHLRFRFPSESTKFNTI